MDENKLWNLHGFIVLLIYCAYSKDNHIIYEYIPRSSLFESAVYTTLKLREKNVLYTLVKYSKAAVHFIC